MMDEAVVAVGRHAILIGINSYMVKPLRGCVRDVLEMKEYLSTKRTLVDVQLFTATATEGPNIGTPTEELKLWPTYENINRSLAQVTSRANPGDFVYIHYSGHGTRIRASQDSSSTHTGDVALSLIERVDGSRIRYLRGVELAHSIKNMLAKGLVVTVVLDWCFSGWGLTP